MEMERLTVQMENSPEGSTTTFDRLFHKFHNDGPTDTTTSAATYQPPRRAIDRKLKKISLRRPTNNATDVDAADSKTLASDETEMSGVTFSSTPEQHVASRWGARESLGPRKPTREEEAKTSTAADCHSPPTLPRRKTDMPLPRELKLPSQDTQKGIFDNTMWMTSS